MNYESRYENVLLIVLMLCIALRRLGLCVQGTRVNKVAQEGVWKISPRVFTVFSVFSVFSVAIDNVATGGFRRTFGKVGWDRLSRRTDERMGETGATGKTLKTDRRKQTKRRTDARDGSDRKDHKRRTDVSRQTNGCERRKRQERPQKTDRRKQTDERMRETGAKGKTTKDGQT